MPMLELQESVTIINELAGIPGFDRDEKLRKELFEITRRNKVWIG
jgi:hypothetical protein